MSWWPAVVFGWPAILLSIAMSFAGILGRRPWLPAVAAVIASPFSLYLAGTPRIGPMGFLIPLLLVACGVAIHYRRSSYAWMLLAPGIVIVGAIAVVVLQD
jgi:hypothetical protein